MTDSEMEAILDMIDDIFVDQISSGHHPITVASVVFAVAIKHLKKNLDKEDFSAIIDEIRHSDIDDLIEIKYIDVEDEKDRTIH
jgi:hypothetical protein